MRLKPEEIINLVEEKAADFVPVSEAFVDRVYKKLKSGSFTLTKFSTSAFEVKVIILGWYPESEAMQRRIESQFRDDGWTFPSVINGFIPGTCEVWLKARRPQNGNEGRS